MSSGSMNTKKTTNNKTVAVVSLKSMVAESRRWVSGSDMTASHWRLLRWILNVPRRHSYSPSNEISIRPEKGLVNKLLPNIHTQFRTTGFAAANLL